MAERIEGSAGVPLLETAGRKEELHEIEEDADRSACEELNALCRKMSFRLAAYVRDDTEFERIVQALQGAVTVHAARRGRRFRATRA